MLPTVYRLKVHRSNPPLLKWRTFCACSTRLRASTRPLPNPLDVQQSEAVARALRNRQAQLGVDEPFFYVHRNTRKQWPSLLRSLNMSFRKSAIDPESVMWQSRLWTDYTLAKDKVRNILDSFSNKAWDALWKSQSIRSPANPDPQSRHLVLLNDMRSVGLALTVPQRLAHLHGLFTNGNKEEVLEEWEAGYSLTGGLRDIGHKLEFLELGVRIQLDAGNIERAKKILKELVSIHSTWSSGLPVQVILAQLNAKSPGNIDQGFELYRQLSVAISSKLTRYDYDTLLLAFLKLRDPLKASVILMDMISSGHLATEEVDADAEQTIHRIKAVMALCTNDEDVNEVGLKMLSVLRPSYCDLLFAEWLVALFSGNMADSAVKVLELMYERGVKPRSKHFNLMLGSLFRTKNINAIRQAEAIAWKMIEERTSAIPARRNSSANGQYIPFFLKRHIPRATAATFVGLLNHYAESRRWDALQETKRVLEEYNWTSPGAGVLNASLQAELHSGDYGLVWRRFHSLGPYPGSETNTIVDGGTYWRLWLCLRQCSFDTENPVEGAPSPRDLMASMATWATMTSSGTEYDRKFHKLRRSRGAISSVVSSCFALNKDLPGQLVAMHVLYGFFRVSPTTKTAEAIHKQLCLVDLPSATKEQRVRINTSGVYSKRMERILKVSEVLAQRRVKQALDNGKGPLERLQQDKDDFLLNSLSELIRVILARQFTPEQVENMIDQAKRDMGVPNMATGDVDAFGVL